MGRIFAFLGILIIGGGLMAWKFAGKTKNDGATGLSNDKKTSSGNMQIGEKKVSARVSYDNPAGGDNVAFTLTVNAEGVIIAAVTEVLATHDISKKRQDAFATGLMGELSGKRLDDLSLIDRVGGSSLTTKAFNQALPQLKAQL